MDEYYAELLADMSSYEMMALQDSSTANLTQGYAIFLSVLFAYLAVAYIVGDQLSKFQVWVVTGIYSAFILLFVGGLYDNALHVARLNKIIYDVDYTAGVSAIIALLFASWVMSLVFMVNARSKSKGD